MKLIQKHLGPFGRYQGLFYALLFLPGAISGSQTLLFVFTGAVPEHRCFIEGVDSDNAPKFNETSDMPVNDLYYVWSQEEEGKKYCDYCPGAFAKETPPQTQANNKSCSSNEAQACRSGHVYDRSQYRSSLAMKFNMVCDGHWRRDAAKSMFMVGKLVGTLIFALLSDLYGPRTISLVCSITGIVTFNVVPALPTFGLVCVFQLINGCVAYGAFLTAFVFVMELVGGAYRTVCGVMVQAFYTLGYIYVGVVAYLLRDWTHIQWVVSCPVFLLIPYNWFWPESIRWLVKKGRTNAAFNSMKKIAQFNGVDLNEAELKRDLAKEAKAANDEKPASVIGLFQYPVLGLHTAIVFFSWFSVAMTYYGIAYNTDDLPGSIYVNFILHGVVELPGLIVCVILMEKIGRRLALSSLMMIGGLCFIASACIPPGNPKALNAMTLIGRAFIVGALAVMYNYAVELYPKAVSRSGTGISSEFGRFGSILAPQVHLLEKDHGFYVPMLIYGSFSVAAGILDLLLPETKGVPVPKTIQDAAVRPVISMPKFCKNDAVYDVSATTNSNAPIRIETIM